jgi:hypothetical protein
MGEALLLAVRWADGDSSSIPSSPKGWSWAPSRRLKGWAARTALAWSSGADSVSSRVAGQERAGDAPANKHLLACYHGK